MEEHIEPILYESPDLPLAVANPKTKDKSSLNYLLFIVIDWVVENYIITFERIWYSIVFDFYDNFGISCNWYKDDLFGIWGYSGSSSGCWISFADERVGTY